MIATATGEAETFLRTLHGKHEDFIELRLKNGGGDFHSEFFPAGELYRAAARAEGLSATHDVFVGVGARDGKGGTRENMTSLSAVWADIDVKDGVTRETLRERIKGLPRPSMIVNSGGGWHLYWILKEGAGPEDFERIRNINSALAAILGGDQGACDPARILRVPGTLNRKKEYGTPRPVRLLKVNAEEYNLSDFDVYLPAGETQGRKKAAPIPEVIREREGIGRHNTLTSLAGSMRNRGATAAEILPALVEMNKRCSPPVSEKDLAHIAESMERYPAGEVFKAKEQDPTAKTASPVTVKGPEALCYETLNPKTATELFTMALPDPEPLIDGLLYPETVLVIGALVKMHKTWAALQVGLGGISGTDFLGHAVRRKLRVLYIGGEGSDRTTRKRLMLAVGYVPGLQDGDLDNLGVVSSQGRVKLDTVAGEEWLQRVSEEYDIIIIDPYYRFLSVGSENLHEDQRTIQDVLDRLKAKGKAIVIVHHLRKPQGADAGAAELRGAGLDAFADTILLLSRKKGAEKRFNLKYILRHDEEPDDLELSLNGPLLQVATPLPPKVTAEDLIAAIDAAGGTITGTALVRNVRDVTEGSKNEVEKVLAGAIKEKAIGWKRKEGKGQGRLYYAMARPEDAA